MDRREAILLGIGALAGWAGLSAGEELPNLPRLPARQSREVAEAETFWATVRAQFELDPSWIVLVTVVRGVTPRAVRERTAAEAARQNAFRPRAVADPEWHARVRTKAAALIGAGSGEVALTRNTTEGITTVIQGWPLAAGDEILTSSQEHAPYLGTLALRAARDRLGVRQFHSAPRELILTNPGIFTTRSELDHFVEVLRFEAKAGNGATKKKPGHRNAPKYRKTTPRRIS